jgi:thiamine transport system substrate-binding protein
MERREFIAAAGTGAVAGLAGCVRGTPGGERTLVVGTYGSLIDSPSTSPGVWLKERFEEEFDARLVWQTPSNEVAHYVERVNAGVDVEADAYVGLTVDDLVTVDEQADADLFAGAGDVAGLDDVKSGLDFDPQDRAVPYDTGYVSLVYDGTSVEAPETFEGLTDPEFEGDLVAQNPDSSATGLAFLLHTVHEFGPDGYLDYWERLQDNGVRVLGSWEDAYAAWSEGEAPMVVSYSTDQVFADQSGADLEKHQVRFLNDQAYANPEGAAVFANANEPDLAREFLSFLLRPEVQGEIAVQNVQFPATTTAELPEDYADLAKSPPEPVTFTYEELQGSQRAWVEDWVAQFASN